MSLKPVQKHLITFTFAGISTFNTFNRVLAQTNTEDIIKQSDRAAGSLTDRYSAENITQVQQLRDLSPLDWNYEAVRNLAEKYGCMKGFPDGTFQGDRPISRYELAAGLNSCLEKIESFVYNKFGQSTENLITIVREDNTESELATFAGKVDQAESKIAILEYNQFSTTSKLYGEAVFGLGSVLSGTKDDGETEIDCVPFFGNQINLELATSFTGEDELSIEIESANLPDLADVTDTFQGKLSFSGSNDNNLELDLLAYTFPLGDRLKIIIGSTGLAADDIAETINILEGDNGDGAISNFGGLNPIYETAGDAGIGIVYELGEIIEFSGGYLASPANEPTDDGEIFNAPYGAIAQAIISPSNCLDLAFTYIHSRDRSDTDMGSNLSNLQSFTGDELGEAVPTVSDSYGAEFSYGLSDFLTIGGWGGLSKVTALSSLSGESDLGTQDVWNWAITLAFPDLGKEGDLGGIVIGAEPWVTSSSIDSLGEDENMSLHLEAFYQYRLSDNLALTPGIVWINAPDNSDREDDLVIGAIRTTFTF